MQQNRNQHILIQRGQHQWYLEYTDDVLQRYRNGGGLRGNPTVASARPIWVVKKNKCKHLPDPSIWSSHIPHRWNSRCQSNSQGHRLMETSYLLGRRFNINSVFFLPIWKKIWMETTHSMGRVESEDAQDMEMVIDAEQLRRFEFE